MKTNSGEEVLRVNQVFKSLNGPAGNVDIIKNLSFSLNSGEIVSIIGPSGCGKSTLLKLIASIIKPSSGAVMWPNCIDSNSQISKRLNVGFVFQQPALLPWLTVKGNIELPSRITGQRSEPIKELLQNVGLQEFTDYKPEQLSGGMKQRLALARAISTNPDIICLDEPFSSLDEIVKHELHILLQQLYLKRKFSAVFVTHDIQEAIFMSHRVLVFSNRPATLIAEFNIEEGYPRTDKFRYSEKLLGYSRKIREKLTK